MTAARTAQVRSTGLGLAAHLGRSGSQPSSRADQVAEQIAEAIAGLEPGTRLGTKSEIREQAEVSIGTFNESLRILQSRGLIDLRRGPQGGLFTAERSLMTQLGHAVLKLDVNVASIAEVMDIRHALDPLVLADAITHSSSHDVELMRAQLKKMAEAVASDDGIQFLHANWKLHATIANATPRPILKGFYLTLLDMIEQHTIDIASAGADEPLAGFHERRYDVHVRLVDAIAAGDAKEAQKVLREHNKGIARPQE